MNKVVTLTVGTALIALALAGCARNADVASYNISAAADNFEVARRVVLYNGITNEYIQEVDGLCSLGNDDPKGQVSVTCKTDKGYIKHIWVLGDNVTVFAQQLIDVPVSTSFYSVTFKPSVIVPEVQLK